jgi:hypothetical protein
MLKEMVDIYNNEYSFFEILNKNGNKKLLQEVKLMLIKYTLLYIFKKFFKAS